MVAQQLQQPAQATADATGAATFTFPSVPQGLAWLGNVRVASAPYAATFVATIGLDDWGAWTGPTYGGQIRADSNVALVVKATNLVPGVQYNATWLGLSDNTDQVGPAMATATPPPALAFATASFFAGTVAGILPSSHTAIFSCSNVKGARYVFTSVANTFLVTLSWFQDSAGKVPLGSRTVVVGDGMTATFTHPHLGDYIQLTFEVVSGDLDLTANAAHHDSELTVWSDVTFNDGTVALPDVLIFANISTATTETIAADTIFAGSCGYYIEAGAATWTAQLQGCDEVGNWDDLYAWDETTGSNIAQRITGVIVVPPVPLRIVLTNVTGGSPHSFEFCLTANSWGGT